MNIISASSPRCLLVKYCVEQAPPPAAFALDFAAKIKRLPTTVLALILITHFSHCSDHPGFGPETRTPQAKGLRRRFLDSTYSGYQTEGGNCDILPNLYFYAHQ